MDVTKFLALYGAILSSIGFGWNLYRDSHDRAKLEVSASIRRFVTAADGRAFAIAQKLSVEGASNQAYIVISVTNVGRRPVMIKGWGGRWCNPINGKRMFTIIGRDLPKMLSEGEYHLEYTDDFKVTGKNVKDLYVWDSSGKEWKLPKGEFKRLKQEVRTIQTV
jgi:hypothetical protein